MKANTLSQRAAGPRASGRSLSSLRRPRSAGRPGPSDGRRPARGSLAWGYLALIKPRVTGLSVASAAAGYRLAAAGPIELRRFFAAVACTFLAAAGAGALNQYLERGSDAVMRRTTARPLPSGLLSPRQVLVIGTSLALAGTAGMATWTTPLAAVLTVGTLLLYLFAYTPLKAKSSAAMWVGAIPGALPPLIGWTAAGGTLGVGAWSLYAVLFLWQIPHFLAIAWISREDYLRAGLPVLTAIDPSGIRTGRQVLLHAALLVAASLVPFWSGLAGSRYLAIAAALGLMLAAVAVLFRRSRTERRARLLLKAGVIYLPCLLLAMILARL